MMAKGKIRGNYSLMKYQCPCCGNYTLPDKPAGTYYICKVCYWEDDNVQYDDPDYRGGANGESLNQARRNYKEFGVSDKRFLDKVRKPLYEELPENN